MPVRDRCPDCGAKLPASTVRLAWCVDHTPVKDWMCWNAVLRVVLPVVGTTLLLTFLLEALLGGLNGLVLLLSGGLIPALLGLLAGLVAVLLLLFILQGDDLLDCVIDSTGLHVQQYLASPTPFRLLLRLRSPEMMAQTDDSGLLLISSRDIPWKDVRRVQLWPEKTMLLIYAPRWWMRLYLPCSPFVWEDALGFIRDKLGKRKDVILPPECIPAPAPKAAKPKAKKTRQLSISDIPPQPIPEEDVPPADWTQGTEQPQDFTPLSDVLEEIRQGDKT